MKLFSYMHVDINQIENEDKTAMILIYKIFKGCYSYFIHFDTDIKRTEKNPKVV